MARRALTQKQIASRLGISPATVSLVLRDPATNRASTQTKERIYDLLSTDSMRARTPTAKADTILFIMENGGGAFFQLNMLQGAQSRAADLGLKLEVVNPSQDFRRFVIARYVKGVLVQPHELPTGNAKVLEDHFRTVTLNAWRQGRFTGIGVQIDEFGGFRQALEHLIACGHRRVGFLNFRHAHSAAAASVSRGREAAFREACEFLGETNVSADIQQVSAGREGNTDEEIRDLVTRWRSADTPPTAVLCFNDTLAAPLTSIAIGLGVRVPEDLSIVGFDNDPACDTVFPRLTSIYPGWAEMGRLGVDLIVDDTFWSTNHCSHYRIIVPARLVTRDSSVPRSVMD